MSAAAKNDLTHIKSLPDAFPGRLFMKADGFCSGLFCRQFATRRTFPRSGLRSILCSRAAERFLAAALIAALFAGTGVLRREVLLFFFMNRQKSNKLFEKSVMVS